METLDVNLESGGHPVATASLGYFARQFRHLRPQTPTEGLNTLLRMA